MERVYKGKTNNTFVCLFTSSLSVPLQLRGTTFTLCMNMYEQIKRQPEFHGQFLLDPTKKTFNWSFLQVSIARLEAASSSER